MGVCIQHHLRAAYLGKETVRIAWVGFIVSGYTNFQSTTDNKRVIQN